MKYDWIVCESVTVILVRRVDWIGGKFFGNNVQNNNNIVKNYVNYWQLFFSVLKSKVKLYFWFEIRSSGWSYCAGRQDRVGFKVFCCGWSEMLEQIAGWTRRFVGWSWDFC